MTGGRQLVEIGGVGKDLSYDGRGLIADGRLSMCDGRRWSGTVVGRSSDKCGPVAEQSSVLKTRWRPSHDHPQRVAVLVKTS